MAIDMCMLGCMLFVFAALLEYAVLLRIRYGNADITDSCAEDISQEGWPQGRTGKIYSICSLITAQPFNVQIPFISHPFCLQM
jgi:hypothetical protein